MLGTFSLEDYLDLQKKHIELQTKYVVLEKSHSELKESYNNLFETIRQLRLSAFGKKSEKIISPGRQGSLFNEAEQEALRVNPDKPEIILPNEETPDLQPNPKPKKKRKRKSDLFANVPVEIKIVDVPENEKIDEYGNKKKLSGYDVQRKLISVPASKKIIEYRYLKYESVGSSGNIEYSRADELPSILPKTACSESLLATTIVNKYGLGLPLYRQEQMYKWLNITLPRTTLARWIIKAADACQPIWNLLEDKLLASNYVACDETRCQVLKENGKKPESTSYMWVRSTPSDILKIILFNYDPSRSGAVVKRLFQDFKGFIQADGYKAYNILEKNPQQKRLGCAMHARRKFFKALPSKDSKTQDIDKKKTLSLAKEGINFFKELYKIEEHVKDMSDQDRYQYRRDKAQPIWQKMLTWATDQLPRCLKDSPIGKAFCYLINEYRYLIGYLEAGNLNIDNGFNERMIRYFAIGRNNWLFSDTPEGAHASSLFYSFVVTARANKLNPWEVLNRIFEEIPLAKTLDDFERITNYLLQPSTATS